MSDLSRGIIYFNGVKIEVDHAGDIINECVTADVTTQDICRERTEQIVKHRRRIKDDVLHNPNGELIQAARALMKLNPVEHDFPAHWGIAACRKLINKPYSERLIIAATLIAAEVDRIKYIEGKRKGINRKEFPSYYPLTPDQAYKLNEPIRK